MSSKQSTGQWQKVSGPKKTQKSSKNPKKDQERKLPTIEDLPPLDILPTSFESLNPKEKPVVASIHAAGNGDAKPAKKKKTKQQKPTVSKFKFNKLMDAINKVPFDDVIKKATETKDKLANADHLIYLKEIVTIYNMELSCPDEPFTNKPSGYPYSIVPKKTQGKLLELFVSSTSENDRKNMFLFCLENMLKCVEKDQCSWGMQICLQVLSSNCPSQLCVGLNKHLEDILRKENVPKRCLAYMWALSNFGLNKHGLQVWLKVMMNLLHLKNLAPFAVSYVEKLMLNEQNKMNGVVTAQEFVDFISWSFDSPSSLNKNLQVKLQKIYPKMKNLALPGNCCQIFEIFLKGSPAEISSYKEIYADVAMECLQNDMKCFSVWRQYYTDTFPMTRELLLRLNSMDDSALKLDDSELRKTIQAFHNTNCDAAQSSQALTSKKEFKDIYNICNDFQEQLNQDKHSAGSSMQSMWFVVLLLAIVGTFVYDLYLHNFVIEQTVTYVKLQSIGVIKYLVLMWKNVKIGSLAVFQWSQTNVFPTLSKINRFLFPYILSFGEMVYTAIQWILDNTEGVREVLAMYARVALEWMDDVGKLLWPYVTSAVQQTIEFMSKLISGEISWCCIKGSIYNGYVTMSSYAVTLWTSSVDYVSGTQL